MNRFDVLPDELCMVLRICFRTCARVSVSTYSGVPIAEFTFTRIAIMVAGKQTTTKEYTMQQPGRAAMTDGLSTLVRRLLMSPELGYFVEPVMSVVASE